MYQSLNQNIFCCVEACILTSEKTQCIISEFFYQLMHYLLDIQNVKIYIKILYSRSYMFRSPMTIIRVLSTEPG